MVTQVMSSGTDPYSDHVVIDKGSNSGVYEGQPVISDRGVVGQVVAVSKFTSRVLLICDASMHCLFRCCVMIFGLLLPVAGVAMIYYWSIYPVIQIFV